MGLKNDQNRASRMASGRRRHPEREENRSSWYLLTGLILGLLLGLAYTWWINPVEYNNASPTTLKETYKNDYRSIIAQVYAATGNFVRAESRLALLGDNDPIAVLSAQAQRILAQGGSDAEARALAMLAAALQNATPQPVQQTTPTPIIATSTTTATEPQPDIVPTDTLPAPTETQQPTPSPTKTETVRFELESQEQLSWLGGEERFFTGLKPNISPGYADYQLEPEENYALIVADGEPLLDLSAQTCEQDDETFWGGWTLVFQTP